MYALDRIFVAGYKPCSYEIYNLKNNTCDSLPLQHNSRSDYYLIGQGKMRSSGEILTIGFQGSDGLRSWKHRESKQYYGYAGHGGDYNGFAINADETLIAYAEYDIYSYEEDFAVLLKVVDLKTKELKHEIRIPMDSQYELDINALSISPNGKYLAISEFYEIQVWQLF